MDMMTTEEKVAYWVGLSDYDLETAEGMMQIKKYLYVAFMCHQAIEKIFKAVYAKQKEENETKKLQQWTKENLLSKR